MSNNNKEKLYKCGFYFVVAILLILIFMINASRVLKESGKCEVYLVNNSSNCKIVSTSENMVGFYLNRYGESCEFENTNYNILDTLKEYDATIVFSEITDSGESYYCYSKKIKYALVVNSKIVNLHIHWTKEKIKIGSPIIFGSY